MSTESTSFPHQTIPAYEETRVCTEDLSHKSTRRPARTRNQTQSKAFDLYNTIYIYSIYIHIDCKTNMSTPGAASDSAGVQKKPDTDSELLDTALLLENLEANAKQMADSLAYISGGLRVNLHAVRGTMSVN